MKNQVFFLLSTVLILALALNSCHTSNKNSQEFYIEPSPVSLSYFDTSITDPFLQLEDLNDSTVIQWYKEQGKYTEKVLNQLPKKELFLQSMQKYKERKAFDIKQIRVTKGGQYFYLKRSSKERKYRLYYRKNLKAKEEILFEVPKAEPHVSINNFTPDWLGSKVAISLSNNSSEKLEIHILDLTTRQLLKPSIKNSFNMHEEAAYWMPDNQGFLYLAYDTSNTNDAQTLLNMKSIYYNLNTNEALDIFSKESCPNLNILPEDFPVAYLNDSKDKYIIGTLSGANQYNDAFYTTVEDIQKGKLNWKSLYTKEQKVLKGLSISEDFIFISANQASNRKICKTSLKQADFNEPKIIVKEKAEEVIQDFTITNSGLYYTSTKNGVEAQLYLNDSKKDIKIELPNTYGRLSIKNKSYSEDDLWVTALGWTTDNRRMAYDAITHTFEDEALIPNIDYPEFKDFIIEELTVASHDGTMVPLSIISKKGIQKNGRNPTLLYGYGAYGIPWRPNFLPDWLTWVEQGGVLCFSHIRGGGEKGETWHKQGQKSLKSNSWKDFIACADFLIDQQYTSKQNLSIYGGSAGGIVIGKSMTERPDLFNSVICEVGMLNATRFANMPSGPNHAKEFGSISDSLDYKSLIEMDAYIHIEKAINYPPFLAIIGMNDLRVSPWQTGKFVARLQHNNTSKNPVLLMVGFNEGHYYNSTKEVTMDKLAGIFAFALEQDKH